MPFMLGCCGLSLVWVITCYLAIQWLALPAWSFAVSTVVSTSLCAALLWCLRGQLLRARHQLDGWEQDFQRFFEAHPNALWIYDPLTWQLLQDNAAAGHLLGRKVEPLRFDLRHLYLGDGPVSAQGLEGDHCFVRESGEAVRVRVRLTSCLHLGRRCGLLIATEAATAELGPAQPQTSLAAPFGHWQYSPDAHSSAALPGQAQGAFEPQIVLADREQVEQVRRQALASGPIAHEYRVQDAQGQVRQVLECIRVTEDAHSGQKTLHGTFMDIGDLHAAHKRASRQHLYERMVNGLPDGVVILRGEHVHFANDAARRMFRLQRSEGRTQFAQFIHPQERSREIDRKAALESGLIRESPLRQVRLLRIDGSEFEAEIIELLLDGPGQADVQLLIRDVSHTRRMQRELEDANKRLQALSQRLIEVQETERRQLAGELHDDIGQQLTGLKLHLQLLARKLDGNAPMQAMTLELTDTLDVLLATIRRLSLALHPLQLESLGLDAAIRTHLSKFLEGTSVAWSFKAHGDLSNLPAQKALVAFRIFQESVSNVIRHAQAGNVQVSLSRSDDGLHLHIVDDGVGFDIQAAHQRAQSLGLTSMQERVVSLDGELKISSIAGVGTRISVRLPKTFRPASAPQVCP
jgi:signal transduction histidine kinase